MTVSNEDYQLKITLNERLLEAFKAAVASSNDDVLPNVQECIQNKTFATFEEIKWLHQHTKEAGKFHELITGAELVLPKPVELPRNPELEARIQRLKAQELEREYRKMTKNVDSVRVNHPEDSISFQIKQINKQLIAVLQFVFSVIAGFVFGFLGIELLVGELEFGFRLLLGVIFALIIALAEIYFLAKKLAEDMDPLPEKPKGKEHLD